MMSLNEFVKRRTVCPEGTRVDQRFMAQVSCKAFVDDDIQSVEMAQNSMNALFYTKIDFDYLQIRQ